jgi:universal stress protein A
MLKRLLLAIDQYESGQTALHFTSALAAGTGAEVRVLHVRELSTHPRVPPLETVADAQFLVHEAAFALRLAGTSAEGLACSERSDRVAKRIVQEAFDSDSDAIVLGSRRLRGIDRLSRRGVREHVTRLSPLPVITAPAPMLDSIPTSGWFRNARSRDLTRNRD